MAVEVAASVTTANFGNLYSVVRRLERAGIDRFHLDVMDGHFVPNITFGPDIVAAFRRLTRLPIDVHLMISEPSRYVERFIDAGSDTITFHVEAPESDDTKHETLLRIRNAKRQPGLAVSPKTSMDAVTNYVDEIDILMVMTVVPGFGGQGFMAEQAPKIEAARRLLGRRRGTAVHVDGGVRSGTAEVVRSFGVDVCVVGSALFRRGQSASDEVAAVKGRT
ncbi:MAG: ribulose-phosphate 3-epimerase [Candidatus Limnocylindrales bacterium]